MFRCRQSRGDALHADVDALTEQAAVDFQHDNEASAEKSAGGKLQRRFAQVRAVNMFRVFSDLGCSTKRVFVYHSEKS